MKDRGILHPQLSRLVASMGHGDLLGVADAGLPVPSSAERVDLAFAPSRPALLEVVEAVLGELRVEAYVLAEESKVHCPQLVEALDRMLPDAEVVWVDHEELKRRCATARGVVRTGEFTPYANVLLRSGVDFSSGGSRRTG
jgi:D-ribose pyranase